MVVKTESCCFTDYRIFPGRGRKFAAKDGKTYMFISHKANSLFHQRIKPVRLTWTQSWRRQNQKGTQQEFQKRKNRKAQKFQKAIVGMTLDDMKKKRADMGKLRSETAKAKEQAAKESKARAQKAASKAPAKGA